MNAKLAKNLRRAARQATRALPDGGLARNSQTGKIATLPSTKMLYKRFKKMVKGESQC